MAGEPRDLYTMGAGRPKPALTDLELTAVTRMDEQSERQIVAVATARAALLAATFAPVKNDAAIKARVDALAEAEVALALSRADAFAKFQATMKLTPAKLAFVVQQVATGNVAPVGVIFGQPAGGRGGN